MSARKKLKLKLDYCVYTQEWCHGSTVCICKYCVKRNLDRNSSKPKSRFKRNKVSMKNRTRNKKKVTPLSDIFYHYKPTVPDTFSQLLSAFYESDESDIELGRSDFVERAKRPVTVQSDISNVSHFDALFGEYIDEVDGPTIEQYIKDNEKYNASILAPDFDISTGSATKIKQWFFGRGVNRVLVGKRLFNVTRTTDVKTLRLLAEINIANYANSASFYENVKGFNGPIRPTVLEAKQSNHASYYSNYESDFSIPVPKTTPVDNTAYTNYSINGINKVVNDHVAARPGSDMDLAFMNINIRNATSRKLDLLTKAYNDVSVIALNEIHLESKRVVDICPAGYKLFFSKSDVEGESYAAVLIKEELAKFTKQVHEELFFCCKIRIDLDDYIYTVTSVYRPNNNSVKYERCNRTVRDFYKELKKCSDACARVHSIVCGDFNTHLLESFSRKYEKGKAKLLDNAMIGYTNNVKKATFRKVYRSKVTYESAIDGVFSRNVDLSNFQHLNLKDELKTDGHLGQKWTISTKKVKLAMEYQAFSRATANAEEIANTSFKSWGIFDEILNDKDITPTTKAYRLEMYLERLVDMCEPETIKTKKIGLFKPILSDNTIYWRDRLNHLRTLAKNDDVYLKPLKEAVKVYRKLSQIDRCKYLDSNKDSTGFINHKEFHKINNKLNKTKSNLKQCPLSINAVADGFGALQWGKEYYDAHKEELVVQSQSQTGAKTKNKNKKTCPIEAINKDSIREKKARLKKPKMRQFKSKHKQFKIETVIWEGNDKAFSAHAALLSCKPESRGRGGLCKRFLGQLHPHYRNVLLELINACITSGTYWGFWKQNRWCPIPKKGDLKLIKNWRPISIGDTVAACVEKIVAAQLLKFMEKNLMFFDRQNGFRSVLGCGTALGEVTNLIRLDTENKLKLAVLIDARNAFGSPLHRKILDELHTFCDDTTVEWFRTFLTGRSFYVEMQGQRSDLIALPPSGVSQGTGPGPILFNLMYNIVLNKLAEKYNIVAYADDLVCILAGNDPESIKQQCVEFFADVDRCLPEIDVKAAPEKTIGLLVGEWPEKPEISFCGSQVKMVEEVCYLGARVDSKMSLDPQCRHVYGRISSASHKVDNMRTYGSKKFVTELYHSQAVGAFQHALELQPLLSKEWYTKLQMEFCNGLKKKNYLGEKQIGRHISYSELLGDLNLRSLHNTHKYLAMNRINSIFMSGKTPGLFESLSDFLVTDIEGYPDLPAIRPFKSESWGCKSAADMTRIYYYLVNKGLYTTRMRAPQSFLDKLDNCDEQAASDLKMSWPYCIMDVFNALPASNRALLGTYSFKNNLKTYFNNLCQHPFSAKNDTCTRCEKVSISLKNKRSIQREREKQLFHVCTKIRPIFTETYTRRHLDYVLHSGLANYEFNNSGTVTALPRDVQRFHDQVDINVDSDLLLFMGRSC